jgi:carotenoid cleavage dioxygenase-like enzyme
MTPNHPYMHSFSVTENYVIIFAAPFYVNVVNMVRYAAPIKGLDWKENDPTIIYIVNIKTGNNANMPDCPLCGRSAVTDLIVSKPCGLT